MPETLPTVSPLAVAVLMLLMSSIVGAWIWTILRLAFGYRVLPPNTPRVVPWGAVSVLATMATWVCLQVAVPAVYFAAFRHDPTALPGTPRPGLSPGEMMTLSAIQNALILLSVPLVLRATSGASLSDFGLSIGGFAKEIPRGIVAYPLLAPIVFGVMMASVLYWGKTNHPLENAIGQDKTPAMVAVLILAGVVFAPAAEELIFRGVLLGWLTRLALGDGRPGEADSIDEPIGASMFPEDQGHLFETSESISSDPTAVAANFPETAEPADNNPYQAPNAPLIRRRETGTADPTGRAASLWLANILVSTIFAALHGAVWPTPVPIFFLSLGLGLLYQRTGSIVASTALHMLFNGVSTLLMFLTLGQAAPKLEPEKTTPIPPPAKATAMIYSDTRFLLGNPLTGGR